MVASQHYHVLWVSELVRKEQCYDFDISGTPIHIVTLKQILLVGWRPDGVKEPQQVVELTMYITGNNKWRLCLYDYRLILKHWDNQVQQVLYLTGQQIGVLFLLQSMNIRDQLIKPLVLFCFSGRLDKVSFLISDFGA